MDESSQDTGVAQGKGGRFLEALLWLWAVAGLGYFYYSRGYLDLLKQLWAQAGG